MNSMRGHRALKRIREFGVYVHQMVQAKSPVFHAGKVL